MKTRLFFLILFFCGILPASLYSQDDTLSAAIGMKNNTKTAELKMTNTDSVTIESIRIASAHYGLNSPGAATAMFGDTIVVTVTNPARIKKNRSMQNPIILFVNRIPFPSIAGHIVDTKDNEIKFILERNYEDNENWDKVLRTGFIHKSLYLGVGLKNGSMTTPISFPIKFTLRTPAESVPFILLCIVLGFFTVFIVWKKRLLQDRIHGHYIYSLSSVHLFFWTQIILLSYVLIWFVCDDMNSIESSNLVLLGISAGTASISTVLNGNHKHAKRSRSKPSEGFFNDILSDNQEFCMHRYQIFIFNVVIGAFFIYKTIDELKMPILNETVLALLGISSATYTAIKAIDYRNLIKTTPPDAAPPHKEKTKTEPAE